MKTRRKNKRAFRRFFFLVRIPTLVRWRHISRKEERKVTGAKGRFHSLLPEDLQSHKAAPVYKQPVKTQTSGTWRKLRFLLRRKSLFRTQKKEPARVKPSITRSQIRRRQLRFLFNTGKLFRIDRKVVATRFRKRYGYLGTYDYMAVILNSTAMFIIAYVIIWFFQDISSVLAAKTFNISSIVYYWDIDFFIRGDDWSKDSVTVVFGAPVLTAFIIMIFSLVIYSNMLMESWKIKLLVLWLLLHSISQLFGEIISGAILMRGVGWVMAFMLYTDTLKLVIIIMMVIVMILIGVFITRFLLLSGGIFFTNLDQSSRKPFMMSQIFLPFIIGTFAIFFIKQPRLTPFELLIDASMMLVLLPAMMRAEYSPNVFFDEEPRVIKIYWFWILIAFVSLLGFRILLRHGVII